MLIPADVQTAFTAGCAACAAGQLRSSNPCQPGTPLWGGWQRGWMHEFRTLPEPLRAARIAREPDLAQPDPVA